MARAAARAAAAADEPAGRARRRRRRRRHPACVYGSLGSALPAPAAYVRRRRGVGDGGLARRGRAVYTAGDAHTPRPTRRHAMVRLRRRAPARPRRAPRPPAPRPRRRPSPSLPVPTPAPSAPQANHSRVVDVLRTWDTDGDGVISRKEFEKGLRALGLDGDQAEIDELFASMDVNGDGTLDYTELHRLLRVGAAAKKSSYLRDAVTNKPLRMPTSPSPGGGATAHLGGRESPRCATTRAVDAAGERGRLAGAGGGARETWRGAPQRPPARDGPGHRPVPSLGGRRGGPDHCGSLQSRSVHPRPPHDDGGRARALRGDGRRRRLGGVRGAAVPGAPRAAPRGGAAGALALPPRRHPPRLQLEAAGPRGATHSGVVPTTPATEASAAGDAIATALALSGATNCWTTPSAGASAAAAAVEQLRAAVSAASSASGAAAGRTSRAPPTTRAA